LPTQPTSVTGQGLTQELPERKYALVHDIHDGEGEHAEHSDGQALKK